MRSCLTFNVRALWNTPHRSSLDLSVHPNGFSVIQVTNSLSVLLIIEGEGR